MEFNPQWISLGIQITILIATVAGFIKVIYNDLTHLNIAMKESKEDAKKINDKIDKIEDRIGNIEKGVCSMKAVCNERHKRSKKV